MVLRAGGIDVPNIYKLYEAYRWNNPNLALSPTADVRVDLRLRICHCALRTCSLKN